MTSRATAGSLAWPSVSLFLLLSALLLASGAHALEMHPLQTPGAGCEARNATAAIWRAQGSATFVHDVPGWCVVARLASPGRWQAEQWRSVSHAATGWRVALPLQELRPSTGPTGEAHWQPSPGIGISVLPLPAGTVPSAVAPAGHDTPAGSVVHAADSAGLLTTITVPVSPSQWARVIFRQTSAGPQP